jgi:alcohol dehydrogenase (cytochrome c)
MGREAGKVPGSPSNLKTRELENATMRSIAIGKTFAASALALAVSFGAHAVTDQDLLNDHQSIDSVVTYGMGYQGQRYSPMKTLNTNNVKYLQPAWAFSFGGKTAWTGITASDQRRCDVCDRFLLPHVGGRRPHR